MYTIGLFYSIARRAAASLLIGALLIQCGGEDAQGEDAQDEWDGKYVWHTFLGGNGREKVVSSAMDSSGNIFITGLSSYWEGPNGQFPLNPRSGNNDVFVLKVDPFGNYLWHTFYGALDNDYVGAIAVDENGNSYVIGSSFVSWEGPNGQSPLDPHSGVGDSFALKLDTNGAYQWHSFYGNETAVGGSSVAVDEAGNIYLLGCSYCTWNGPNGENPINPHTESSNDHDVLDILIVKLNSSGAYLWHTFLGGDDNDRGSDIAVDEDGNIFVIAEAQYWEGPDGQSPLNEYTGFDGYEDEACAELCVIRLDSGGAYEWHTFYAVDKVSSFVLDGAGNIYVTGGSIFPWFGQNGEHPLNAMSDSHAEDDWNYDISILKLGVNGHYKWHTFYGNDNEDISNYAYESGNNSDIGTSVAIDLSGNPIITGGSETYWKGPDGQNPLHEYSGYDDIVDEFHSDIFVLKLSSNGAYQWHTYYGSDCGTSLAIDGNGNYFISGVASASWSGPGGFYSLNPYIRDDDIFLLKMTD